MRRSGPLRGAPRSIIGRSRSCNAMAYPPVWMPPTVPASSTMPASNHEHAAAAGNGSAGAVDDHAAAAEKGRLPSWPGPRRRDRPERRRHRRSGADPPGNGPDIAGNGTISVIVPDSPCHAMPCVSGACRSPLPRRSCRRAERCHRRCPEWQASNIVPPDEPGSDEPRQVRVVSAMCAVVYSASVPRGATDIATRISMSNEPTGGVRGKLISRRAPG